MKRMQVNMAFYSNYEMARLFVRMAHKDGSVLLIEKAQWLANLIENTRGEEAQKLFENKEEREHLMRMISNASPDVAIITLKDADMAERIREALFNLAPPDYREEYRIGLFINGEEML